MTKKASIVIISILFILVLFLGTFSFLPQFDVGAYKVYHSPASLIQKGNGLTDSLVGEYVVEDGELTSEELTNAVDSSVDVLFKRLSAIYGYYDSDIVVDNGRILVTVPVTADETAVSEDNILANLMVTGAVEFLPTDSQEYDESKVIMSNFSDKDHFKGATVKQFVSGAQKYYIVEAGLTAEGLDYANDNLTHFNGQASAYCAIDGNIAYQVVHNKTVNNVQIYTGSIEAAQTLASFFNHGKLAVDVEQVDTNIIENDTFLITLMALIMAVVIVAFFVFMIVRYGVLSLAGILATLISIVCVVIFMGLAYFGVFTVYAFVAFLLGMAVFGYCNLYSLENVRVSIASNSKASMAIKNGFNKSLKRVLLISGICLVVGIILWVIPTAITVPVGNVLVYCAVMSAITSVGITRGLAVLAKPIGEEIKSCYGIKG